MGRKRKGRTRMVRVRLTDIPRLKAIAQSMNLSIPDTITYLSRKRR